MESWPGTLPSLPLQDGFSVSRPDGILRSADGEPRIVRRRTANIPVTEQLSYRLTLAQKVILDYFYLTTLYMGSDPFSGTDPATGSAAVFRFVGPPVCVKRGVELDVTIVVEVLP